MKYKLTIFISLLNLTFYSQTSSTIKIEETLKKRAYEGKFDKLSIDLNADTKEDLIYTYQCGEPKCVAVYLKLDDTYKEVVNENCTAYSLWEKDEKKYCIWNYYIVVARALIFPTEALNLIPPLLCSKKIMYLPMQLI